VVEYGVFNATKELLFVELSATARHVSKVGAQ
jgi:hypothetical protein